MRRYIYHYYAFCQLEPGSVAHTDGVVRWNTPVENYDQMREITQMAAAQAGWPHCVIGSFTYLGRERWLTALRRGSEQ